MSRSLKKKIMGTLDKNKQIITWAKHVHAENVSHNEIYVVFESLALLLHIQKVLCLSLSVYIGFLTEIL